MNVYNLHVQIYVDGEPSGAPFVSPGMYGAVTINQSITSARSVAPSQLLRLRNRATMMASCRTCDCGTEL